MGRKNAWVTAKYIEAHHAPRTVEIAIEGYNLIVRERGGARELARWPRSSLTQKTLPSGAIELQWLPDPTRIEIADTVALRRASWSKRLPDRLDRNSYRHAAFWVFCCGTLALAGVYGVPRLASSIPWRLETMVFGRLAPYSDTDTCAETGARRVALDKLLARIYPLDDQDRVFPLTVEVVREQEINAFAYPGAKIFVFDGLIKEAESPEEVAGILAHEIEHVKRRHVLRLLLQNSFAWIGLSQVIKPDSGTAGEILKFLINAQFTKSQEAEADEGALDRLLRAKVATAGMANFFSRMAAKGSVPVFLSDHPSEESRQALFERGASAPSTPILSALEWGDLKAICR